MQKIPLHGQMGPAHHHHQILSRQNGQTESELALTEGALAKYVPF